MQPVDLILIFQWWLVLFLIGIVFLPLTTRIFNSFFDRGYIFSKIIGITIISYSIWLLGNLKILPFTQLSIVLVVVAALIFNLSLFAKVAPSRRWHLLKSWKIFLLEEIIFLAALFFWSYVRAHEPSIHGLEKFMDFGIINSILRADYFPPKDIWLTPETINYYYFGHLVTTVLTKLSGIDSAITYNLMVATLFALTFTSAFSIGVNLFIKAGDASRGAPGGGPRLVRRVGYAWGWRAAGPAVAGFLTAFLVTFAGNLQTIYLFFKGFLGENPQPPWTLLFSPTTFPNNYWYPNATRFIPFTIHEFPSYSFVVSDLHSHVLNVPVVLLMIAILFSLIQNSKFKIQNYNLKLKSLELLPFDFCLLTLLLGFLLAIMYMTNAWDGLIYFFLTTLVIIYLQWLRIKRSKISNTTTKQSLPFSGEKRNPILQILPINKKIQNLNHFLLNHWVIDLLIGLFVYWLILGIGSILFALPFSLNFKPFVSGIGIICAPDFLTKIGKIGPFLFEGNHCARSPFWQLLILWGFFYFWAILFIFKILKLCHWKLIKNLKLKISKACVLANYENLSIPDLFVLFLITLSTLLILIPEFIYLKDIYPAHYRANTMFKLTYQAFILLSISAGYIILRIVLSIKYYVVSMTTKRKILTTCYMLLATFLVFLVSIYSYFAVTSYYNNFKVYSGLDGFSYFKNLYPEDYEAILWLKKNIQGQPVILEANGESYTDFARASANTGLSTVIGWPVHEWLWRGSYEVAAPRIADVQTLYETPDIILTRTLIKKYNLSLVFIGDLEHQKYQVSEEKFAELGEVIFQSGQTKIYKIKDE